MNPFQVSFFCVGGLLLKVFPKVSYILIQGFLFCIYSGFPHETGKNTPFCSWLTHDYDRPVVCVRGFATSVFRVESMRCAFFFGRCDLVRDHRWSIHKASPTWIWWTCFRQDLCWCNDV